MDHQSLYNRLLQMQNDLNAATEKDPEQDVMGIALPVLDALISEARLFIANDPVIEKMYEVISVPQIELGDPVRALDALLVVGQLIEAIGHPPALRIPGRGIRG